MIIDKISNRNIIIKHNVAEWDLNIHLIMGNKYNFIIDTGLGSWSVMPVMKYLANNTNPVIIINTHYHWDHIWGNHLFANSTIISHRLCREKIIEKWDDMISRYKQFIKGEVQMCLPNMVFESSLYFPDDKIRLFHTPGHTYDCISVFDEEDKVLNISDNIGDSMDEIVPSIETDKETYHKTLLRYKNIGFKTCVSGHNRTFGKETLELLIKESKNIL